MRHHRAVEHRRSTSSVPPRAASRTRYDCGITSPKSEEATMRHRPALIARQRLRCTFAGIVAVAAAGSAWAQYPTKPILIVAPFTVGGDSDLAARNIAAVVPRFLGQNAIVLNKVGASGAIGSEYVRRASADGYTLLLARVGSQAVLPALKSDLSYKWNDFTFLGLLELNPYVCSVRADAAIKSFVDL